MTRFKLLAVIDNTQQKLWNGLKRFERKEGTNKIPEWIMQNVANDDDRETFEELPVFDEIIHEDGDCVVTYHDLGMCESVYLYRKI